MKFRILGHRGSGASDAPFNQARDAEAGIARLDENSLESHRMAMRKGAHGTETDLIETLDGNIVLTHANEFSQHVLHPDQRGEAVKDKKFIGELSSQDIALGMRVGKGYSRIPDLKLFLEFMQSSAPRAFLNLELKGVQSTNPDHHVPSRSAPSLADKTLRIVEDSGFPLEQIRFSSFSMSYLEEMAEVCPEAQLGMLYDLPQEQTGDAGMRMFSDRPDVYLPFTVAAMAETLQRIPTLKAVHPEVQSLTNETVRFAARMKLDLATWGWREYSPLGNGEGNQRFANALRNGFNLCAKHKIGELIVITDHIADVHAFVHS
jgi:glycerophosphoryl diester phosphodiesterase